ncbi:hypothetical protein VFPPC_17663 [Pochonia chlamydosporia 170]|uniref:Uncharacterized protein n=1 Tax=Pochonia chlamydosporia 170 TaxID=1380566 RepID=A0A219AQX8_METCM|nr:hypothetical protein VFPPC_17663 [Pochonia chlamydosporia 170]OWT43161.1 hypothetical protein VFPPC_17663 [Pochonia chlamydosporia 170]
MHVCSDSHPTMSGRQVHVASALAAWTSDAATLAGRDRHPLPTHGPAMAKV